MAHEVNQQKDCFEGVRTDANSRVWDALVSQIGLDRLELWIPECTTWDLQGNVLKLSFASEFSSQLAQKMLGKDLVGAVSNFVGEPAEVRMTAADDDARERIPSPRIEKRAVEATPTSPSGSSRQPEQQSTKQDDSAAPRGLRIVADNRGDKEYLWDRFVQGESNQIGWATAKLIINSPGSMTPVFLHGPSGVGKSLLVSAIAQRLRTEQRLPRVVQMTSEQFLNDFTDGLRGGGLPMFRRKYRDVEVLILEDIHFFLGKKSSIAEVKHTIDNLLRLKKQVICTADRSLNDLNGLGSELVARLRGGLTTPIFPLDEQVRFEILQRDLAVHDIALDESLTRELASRLTGDGRVLSGIVNRLVATVAFQSEELNWDSCWAAVGDLVQATQAIVRIVDIDRVICDVFGLEADSLQSSSKIRRVSQPRMLAMFLARKYTPSAYNEIGQYFGKRRHSTVISAEKTVESWLDENADIEIGRGLSVRQAIRHVESQLQVG